ncbi:alpha-galactosidase [Microbacterium trichothecenolyticum]|uniref:alpha-galactosidase n=1 Tax=Microbacterium trichothecenolyticum TaxID=69370 RepID=A0A0M2H3S6_MICTR|nr:alpha-galactosidase [Microbacterium trichothecenolyticum]KJL41087.1 Alpha-galactosidase [Microbacterium trichothecenolyticum]
MTPGFIRLESEGVGVLLDARGPGLPHVLHWGAPVGAITDADADALAKALSRQTSPGTLDAAWQVSLSPQEGDGWTGRPGMQLRRDGVVHHARWDVTGIDADDRSVTVQARDAASALRLSITAGIEAGGVVWVQHALAHDGEAGATSVDVDWLEATLPVPSTTDTLLTFDGRWTREKRPVVTPMPAGATVRQTRRGRPGHDNPVAAIAGIGAPRWQHGALWGVHLAWSSDLTTRVDRVTDAVTLIGAGELLRPGEIRLAPGDEYRAPRAAFVYTAEGLDGFAHRVHTWLRARPQHPSSVRPLVLNTWEAVYFDHDPDRLTALAERAAEVGIERFVLDDGWFQGRRDDSTSLGDWVVDRTVWPDGLGPLAARVHELGMQFGLWFEPEMISLDSDVARAHPDWLLHDGGHLDHEKGLSWRGQYVMDLANPDAYAHVLGQIDALVGELGIDFIKWDHNRDLVESVHDGRPGGHAQMTAVYELIAELTSRHPSLEIESCSSGGARTDLGILEVTDRVWASDSNDPVERQDIQRWTGLLLPPELVGAHVGPTTSHSSGRTTALPYRMATSLLGSAGFEWDILSCADDETAAITRFAALYKELRPIVHGGRMLHPELRDPAWRATAFVADEAAVVVVATVASLEDARAERLRLPGLDRARRYRVRVRREIGAAEYGWIAPEWFTTGEIELPGSLLAEVGLQLPTLWPVQAFVLHLEAL